MWPSVDRVGEDQAHAERQGSEKCYQQPQQYPSRNRKPSSLNARTIHVITNYTAATFSIYCVQPYYYGLLRERRYNVLGATWDEIRSVKATSALTFNHAEKYRKSVGIQPIQISPLKCTHPITSVLCKGVQDMNDARERGRLSSSIENPMMQHLGKEKRNLGAFVPPWQQDITCCSQYTGSRNKSPIPDSPYPRQKKRKKMNKQRACIFSQRPDWQTYLPSPNPIAAGRENLRQRDKIRM